MGAFSMDLRIRAVRAIDTGKSIPQAAQELQVSERWISKLLKQRRDGLGLAPQYAGRCGRPPKISSADQARLRDDVAKFPDASLPQRVARLKLPIKEVQTWRWLARLGITHKKRR
jgi:transposase